MELSFYMPVEWVESISSGGDPDNADFESYYLVEWLSENDHLRLDRVGDRLYTADHVVPGDYEGDELLCREVHFVLKDPRHRTVRKELRISVPAPTKLPLP
jgi:hypothetical protein